MIRKSIQISAGSDVGKERADNEDSYRVVGPGEVKGLDALFVVADGMGGHAAGEVASQMAVDSAIAALSADTSLLFPTLLETEVLPDIESALLKANAEVIAEGKRSPDKRGMGTTCTLGVIRSHESSLLIGHIGDSRGYILRNGVLDRITDDHSVVEEEVRKGLLTLEEAWNDPRRNLITRAIGLDDDPEVDTTSVPLKPGDRIMFCSDGLNSMIRDPEIESILSQGDAGDTVQALIDAANEAGGSDNITVVVADYSGA